MSRCYNYWDTVEIDLSMVPLMTDYYNLQSTASLQER